MKFLASYGGDSTELHGAGSSACYDESYGCGIGIVGGCIGGWGIEGGTDRVVRNGSKDGLAPSVAFRSIGMSISIYGQGNVVPGNLVLTNIVKKII
jgi:hypothetical protein